MLEPTPTPTPTPARGGGSVIRRRREDSITSQDGSGGWINMDIDDAAELEAYTTGNDDDDDDDDDDDEDDEDEDYDVGDCGDGDVGVGVDEEVGERVLRIFPEGGKEQIQQQQPPPPPPQQPQQQEDEDMDDGDEEGYEEEEEGAYAYDYDYPYPYPYPITHTPLTLETAQELVDGLVFREGALSGVFGLPVLPEEEERYGYGTPGTPGVHHVPRVVVEEIVCLSGYTRGTSNSCYRVLVRFVAIGESGGGGDGDVVIPETNTNTYTKNELPQKNQHQNQNQNRYLVIKIAPAQTVRLLRYESSPGRSSLLRVERDVLDALHGYGYGVDDDDNDGSGIIRGGTSTLPPSIKALLPKVLAFDGSRRILDSEVLVLSYLPGVTLRRARRAWRMRWGDAGRKEEKVEGEKERERERERLLTLSTNVNLEVGRILRILNGFRPPSISSSPPSFPQSQSQNTTTSINIPTPEKWGLFCTASSSSSCSSRNQSQLHLHVQTPESQSVGPSSWYKSHVESLLRDGEDMRILLPYAEIRRAMGRWAGVLDLDHEYDHLQSQTADNPSTSTQQQPPLPLQPKFTILDLSTTSILLDPKTGVVTGIVDFERAMWGDPVAQMIAVVCDQDDDEDGEEREGEEGGGEGMWMWTHTNVSRSRGTRDGGGTSSSDSKVPAIVFPDGGVIGDDDDGDDEEEEKDGKKVDDLRKRNREIRRWKKLLYLVLHATTQILNTYFRNRHHGHHHLAAAAAAAAVHYGQEEFRAEMKARRRLVRALGELEGLGLGLGLGLG
ncbi:hypothetical protein DFH27DRAFT_204276 [Peziza echinospora]|nr:hypothetical protein DFH27DRAFT_204276 [Peziza echinospora]